MLLCLFDDAYYQTAAEAFHDEGSWSDEEGRMPFVIDLHAASGRIACSIDERLVCGYEVDLQDVSSHQSNMVDLYSRRCSNLFPPTTVMPAYPLDFHVQGKSASTTTGSES